jgi:glycosyltransferase involved in cell wall biosynthesis
MRIAWFSPMPPDRSGIAAYSGEILPLLRQRNHVIDVFVDRPTVRADAGLVSAHDFVWKHRRQPYDLTVYQMGNAVCHGYMWAYLFRYPGLLVLHDAQLHQARASWLTKRYRPRFDDYLAEFQATERDAPADAAHVIAAGLGEPAFYQHWPLVRLVVERSRLVAVHNDWLRATLTKRYPSATIDAIEMGVADPKAVLRGDVGESRSAIRARHAIPEDAIVVAAFGGITPEKRIGALLRAVREVRERVPALHVMLVGEEAGHYDVREDAARCEIVDRVHATGYVADADVPAYLAAADICSCLRWPTNRETSASWLRCLAAGKPTLITNLAQHAGLSDVAVAIDIVDESSALPRALEQLALDRVYRENLGRTSRAHWEAHHQLEQMAVGYERVLARAVSIAPPHPQLPPHIVADGTAVLRAMAAETGVTVALLDMLDNGSD